MSSLQQLIDRRRSAEPPASQLCHTVEAQVAALVVITSAQERWLFPWHQLAVAHLTSAAGRDQLQLTFASHLVTITGHHLAVFADLIARAQLATVRPAPTKYTKATPNEPFVDALHVTPHAAPGAGR